MFSDCPETTKIILDLIYGDEGDRVSTINQTAKRLRNSRQKDYEKLVQNSKPTECNESALEARDAQITLLQGQLARQEGYTTYWKDKYEECFNKLKKETTRWWKF